jgi:small subunit ribosomal protein S10
MFPIDMSYVCCSIVDVLPMPTLNCFFLAILLHGFMTKPIFLLFPGAIVFGNSDKRSRALLRCGVMAAKIRVVMKSFTSQSNKVKGLLPYTKKVGLPESRALFTVLRSPHIDKKSREQFSMHIKKQFVEQTAEMHELDKKLFWLKRLRIPGAQYEVQISFKTRLDMGSLKSLARS